MAEPDTLITRVDGCQLPQGDVCDACGEVALVPEHAHSKCTACGFIRPCCGW